MQNFLIGLGCGLAVALIVFIVLMIRLRELKASSEKEKDKLRQMLAARMELESEGLNKLKSENEELRKQNENLRISMQTYAQKPGRKELQRLNVYQKAVDRLIINSPGFGAAWQAALKESEDEFEKTYVGIQAFVRRLIPTKTDAQIIEIEDKQNKE